MLKNFLKRIWDGGDDPSDAELYALVVSELSDGDMDVGLWAKACTLSGGVNDQAKTSYIKMRVQQIKELRRAITNAASHEQRALEDMERQARRDGERAEATQREIEAYNAPIQAQIEALDVQRRPLLDDLYGATSDRQRRRSAERLLPLDSRRSDLVRRLR